MQPSSVQALAERHGSRCAVRSSLRSPEVQAEFAALAADAAVVAAYGLILPKPVLAAPRLGCLNVHASLLPRWRGAAPIQRAMLAGDGETGVTIMQMDEGLDTGPMLLQQAMPIGADNHRRANYRTARRARRRADAGRPRRGGAGHARSPGRSRSRASTYAAKLRREEAWLDWRKPAAVLERQVRGFDPWPGAYFLGRGERIRVLRGRGPPGSAAQRPDHPSTRNLTIACGEGALRPLRLQRAGRGALDTAAFLRGFALPPGTVLPCPATS